MPRSRAAGPATLAFSPLALALFAQIAAAPGNVRIELGKLAARQASPTPDATEQRD